jgi:hypothetical protein
MIRVRFKANEDDPRPINWPIKHPYWISGYGHDHAIVIAYADDEQYIMDNWPEAEDLDITPVDEYKFTSRFPKPEWLAMKEC